MFLSVLRRFMTSPSNVTTLKTTSQDDGGWRACANREQRKAYEVVNGDKRNFAWKKIALFFYLIYASALNGKKTNRSLFQYEPDLRLVHQCFLLFLMFMCLLF